METHTEEYIAWNNKTHNCIIELIFEYSEKAEDIFYTDEERIAFYEYINTLGYVSQVEFIHPNFTYPIPPDMGSPFIPTCSL